VKALSSVVHPKLFVIDPDPTFLRVVDPDPTCIFQRVPDPALNIYDYSILPMIFKELKIAF
jgi:hypothetical protein